MSEAPERIWAGRWPHGGRAWRDRPDRPHISTEYIRSDLTPAPGWQPIETCKETDRAVLIYSVTAEQDEDWPGHAMTVSNPAYVTSGNAALHGYTHWMPLPAPPSEGVEP